MTMVEGSEGGSSDLISRRGSGMFVGADSGYGTLASNGMASIRGDYGNGSSGGSSLGNSGVGGFCTFFLRRGGIAGGFFLASYPSSGLRFKMDAIVSWP